MNPIEKLCEAIRACPEVRAEGILEYSWDMPKDEENGVWFLDVILNKGSGRSRHVVVEWRPHQATAGFGLTCISNGDHPYGGVDAWKADVDSALRWIVECAQRR